MTSTFLQTIGCLDFCTDDINSLLVPKTSRHHPTPKPPFLRGRNQQWKLLEMALSTISNLNNVNTTRSIYHDSYLHRTNEKPRIRIAAAQSSGGGLAAEFEEGKLERPKWTGETPLSRLVGALISFKPLYSVLKLGARNVLIR